MNDLEASPQNSLLDAEAQRRVQDVQAALVIAQRFPRDQTRAVTRIMTACRRPSLAEKALYSFPRGKNDRGEKTLISGPSIRLAEVLAQAWGNMQSGISELEQRNGESICEAFCWDLETNSRQSIQFTVKHTIDTRAGRKTLTDPRDIYEHVANYGARRKRACILALIPPDIVEDAVDAVRKTLTIGSDIPMEDRIKKMVLTFKDVQVSQEMLEAWLGHPIKDCSADEIVELSGLYFAIRDGVAKRSDLFDVGVVGEGAASELTERFSKRAKAKTVEEPKEP